jgi:hypothetical protein
MPEHHFHNSTVVVSMRWWNSCSALVRTVSDYGALPRMASRAIDINPPIKSPQLRGRLGESVEQGKEAAPVKFPHVTGKTGETGGFSDLTLRLADAVAGRGGLTWVAVEHTLLRCIQGPTRPLGGTR